jgi:hypothetical protein
MCCRTLDTPAKLTLSAATGHRLPWESGISLLTPLHGAGNATRWCIAVPVGGLWADGSHDPTNNITQRTPRVFSRLCNGHGTCRRARAIPRSASRLAIRALFTAKAARRMDPITGVRVLLGHERNATIGWSTRGANNADATKPGTRDRGVETQPTTALTERTDDERRTPIDAAPLSNPTHQLGVHRCLNNTLTGLPTCTACPLRPPPLFCLRSGNRGTKQSHSGN